jgi:hypothetical protein
VKCALPGGVQVGQQEAVQVIAKDFAFAAVIDIRIVLGRSDHDHAQN